VIDEAEVPFFAKTKLLNKKKGKRQIVPDAKPDRAIKNVTTRFGRTINLKVPQF
jgi:hypothetical protein